VGQSVVRLCALCSSSSTPLRRGQWDDGLGAPHKKQWLPREHQLRHPGRSAGVELVPPHPCPMGSHSQSQVERRIRLPAKSDSSSRTYSGKKHYVTDGYPKLQCW
jgi:hypothetical protein